MAYLSVVDQEATLHLAMRVETGSEGFGSAKLVVEHILKGEIRRMERYRPRG